MKSLVGAAIACLIAVAGHAQTPDKMVFCTGGKSGNYFWAGGEIASRIGPNLFKSVALKNTSGSLDNLRNLAASNCDIGFAQSDVVNQFIIESPATHDQISMLRKAYVEYVHILCPVASGWKKLTDIADAKGARKMIVGPDGSGTAETWRIMRQADGKRYDAIERIADPADLSSAHTVADSKDTCMLWVSGLNSNDMRSANALSVRTTDGNPSMQLISIDDPKMLSIKGLDGEPLYKQKSVSPTTASNGKPALYDHIITNGGWFSSASVDLLSVPAFIMIRNDFKASIGRDNLSRLLEAIDDAQPTIWARVNPAGSN